MSQRPLTVRERAVLDMIGQGYAGRVTADKLGMAYGTLRKHRLSILAKLGLQTSAQLSAAAAALVSPARLFDLDLTPTGWA